MKTASAKNKGRKFQQWVRDKLIEVLDIDPQDIESRSMGAAGEDLMLARSARELFPFSIECKNVERLNFWDAYKQAQENAGDHEPIVFVKRNHQKPLVLVDAVRFIEMQNVINKFREHIIELIGPVEETDEELKPL
jgi:hypothetical protein